MIGPRVREATTADAAAIARVYVETWRAAYAGVLPDAYLVRMNVEGQTMIWRRTIGDRARREKVLVAEAGPGGAVVGFGSAGAARPGPLPYGAEVFTLYVAGDWQGRGIGRRLMGGLFRRLTGAGFNDAFLWVLSPNPSRFFYEAVGGQRVAERQEPFAGALLDETGYAWPDLAAWLAERGTEE